jgi:hypothetical protein
VATSKFHTFPQAEFAVSDFHIRGSKKLKNDPESIVLR